MHDAQALPALAQGLEQEFAQLGARLGHGQAVQVDFGLDPVVTTPEPAQHGFRHAGLAVLLGFARLDVELDRRRRQALAQHLGALGAREARARRGRAARAGARFGCASGRTPRIASRNSSRSSSLPFNPHSSRSRLSVYWRAFK